VNQALIDYLLNRFAPFGIIGFLLFYNFGCISWEPYAILGLTFFIERFSFNTGYSVAFCERNNIKIDHE
jgi:hypothetical protein